MRKFIGMLLFVSVLAEVSQATFIAFEAEDERFIYQEGDKWITMEEETALNGKYITAGENLPPVTDTSFRGFSFPVTAGTYDLYVRLRVGPGNWNDDSIFLSDSTFDQSAALTTYINMLADAIDVDGNPVMGATDFHWVQIDTGYVMAADGTGYLKVSPREDGLDIDAFAYATQEETVSNAILDNEVLLSHSIRGAATNPVPSLNDQEVDSETVSSLSWTAPSDPNIVSISGYDVVFGTEPNMLLNPVYPVTTESLPVTLAYDTTYYWRVDTHLVWDTNEITGFINDTVTGSEWTFTTLPENKVPKVTVEDFLTAMEYLPDVLTGTVNDYGESDITAVAWEVLVPATAKQMIDRTDAADLANLAQITSDPSLLRDWIGSDTRDNNVAGNPLKLTLKGLPAGTYSWTSYHHDGQNQNGVFDATVYDASVSSPATTTDIRITDANSLPISTFTTSIVSDGSDVVLEFTLHPYEGVDTSFFVMNGFELSQGENSLKIDFGPIGGDTMPGCQAYEAEHEVAETFTEQSYSAFGGTVSILPEWGGVATVTDRTNDPSLATQQAEFTADRPGEYDVRLTATDSALQTGSDTMTVTIGEDACAAAQLSPSWTAFSPADINEDCLVNLEDLADLAAEWLDDRNLAAQE